MTDREIDALIAEKVMAFDWEWCSCEDRFVSVKIDGGSKHFSPTSHPAASKQVREKLAERFSWSMKRTKGGYQFCIYDGPSTEYQPIAALTTADTEERAVALCALKTVGIEP